MSCTRARREKKEKILDEEVEEFVHSASCLESEEDDDTGADFEDDVIADPDYKISAEDISLSLNLSNTAEPTDPQPSTSAEPQPSTSMPHLTGTNLSRLKGRRLKRARSPLPVVEAGGPLIEPHSGGFTGSVSDINPKSKEFENITWKRRHLQLHRNEIAFRGDATLPERFKELETPFQCFQYFFTDELLNNIQNFTNLGATQGDVNTKFNVSSIEIRQYIGILVYMSVYRYPSLESYWGEHSFEAIRNTMTSKRFYEIRKHIRFNDYSQMVSNPKDSGHDPLFKIRPVYDYLNKRFDSVPKLARLCVDEQMCPTKMINALRQYMPNKPHKWGIKLFVLCDSSGYCYRFEIYCGAGDNIVPTNAPDLGSTSNIVVRLSQTIPDFKYHILYFDNFYTSLPLMVYLRSRGIFALGTVRKNRINNCKLSDDKDEKLKSQQRGYSEEFVGSAYGVDISSVLWKDTKVVRLLSTYVGVLPFRSAMVETQPEKIGRYDRKNKKYIDVECPRIIKEYNYHMGGVDLMDGLMGRYHIRLKTTSASLKLFYHFIDMAMTNAYILFRRIKPDAEVVELPVFRTQVANGLCYFQQMSEKRAVGRPSVSAQKRKSELPAPKKSYGLGIDARYDHVGHMPDQLDRSGKRQCRLPGCTSETQMVCLKCQVNLCLTAKKKCFQLYHAKP